MIRQKLTVGLIASAFTLSLAPAWAGQAGSRPSNGDTAGSAVPRDSGGGSSSSSPAPSGGGSTTSGSATSGSGSDNSGANGGWMGGNSRPERQPAPRSERAEDQRRGGGSNGGGSSSGRAVPRGSSSSGSGGETKSTAGSNGNNRGEGRNREDVPTYSRPRDSRNPVGNAVERRGPVPSRGGGVYYPGVIYDPYYSYYYDPFYYGFGGRYSSYWNPYGYGYGLGYFAYDPFLFNGYGYGGGGYGGRYGDEPYQGGGGYGSSSESEYRGVGSMRLKVKPANAQVYVDGYYTGLVDSYDGAFQRLGIEAGSHKVEVRAEGYETVQFDVMINPGETVTYKGELKHSH
jgi:hypothetical protein